MLLGWANKNFINYNVVYLFEVKMKMNLKQINTKQITGIHYFLIFVALITVTIAIQRGLTDCFIYFMVIGIPAIFIFKVLPKQKDTSKQNLELVS